ncbi:MAG: hypothetical protein QQW96_16560 [Tychonema bourrellyi B0820]|uniref:hypothetical protein n=1 Tax=Tychonema bourrellyi TaxID=54313 RepID=UPI0015D49266|nr:hypothetical protein [Tychonema bourrellyi]MDQ2099242.1 hypothetical protein [Tychonema bourrellyi B0820]
MSQPTLRASEPCGKTAEGVLRDAFGWLRLRTSQTQSARFYQFSTEKLIIC